MNLRLKNNDFAAVNFFNGCKINMRTDGTAYTVQWHFNDNFLGAMTLGGSAWGRYDAAEFGTWRLKFYHGEELVLDYINSLENKECFLFAKLSGRNQIGKKKDISSLVEYANKVVDEHKCNLKVYFPKTWEYDFSSYRFSPLRLNDPAENVYFGLEKEF